MSKQRKRILSRLVTMLWAGLVLGAAPSAFAQAELPLFRVNPVNEHVWGHAWPTGNVVTVKLGTPAVAIGTATVNSIGDWHLYVEEHGRDLKAGDLVTVTDGQTTVAHTVRPLVVTQIEPETDTVRGTAVPGSYVHVHIHDTYIGRYVYANGQGLWLADFSTPVQGDNYQTVYDIVPGTVGGTGQEDVYDPPQPFGSTYIEWEVDDPRIYVNRYAQEIWGEGWPRNTNVVVTIGASPRDKLVREVNVDASGTWWLSLEEQTALLVGTPLRAECLNVVKTHEVQDLTIAAVDIAADTVRGCAAPLSSVEVAVGGSANQRQTVQADEAGRWIAYFGGAAGPLPQDKSVDIVATTDGSAMRIDDDGDTTFAAWRAAPPTPMLYITWGQSCENGGTACGQSWFAFELLHVVGAQSARFRTPSNTWYDLVASDWWGANWELGVAMPVQADLDAAFSTGTYVLEAITCDGVVSQTVNIASSVQWPTVIPAITSPTQGQSNVSSPEAPIMWSAVANPSFNQIDVEVRDQAAITELVSEGVLGNQATDWLMTGLEPLHQYQSDVSFENVAAGETSEGIPFEAIRSKSVSVEFSTGGLTWDAGYTDLGNGWRWLDWFGAYTPVADNWIYHQYHDYLYISPNALPDSIWLWAQGAGWTWTSSTTYPSLYVSRFGTWFWYQKGSDNPQWFLNLTTGKWYSR